MAPRTKAAVRSGAYGRLTSALAEAIFIAGLTRAQIMEHVGNVLDGNGLTGPGDAAPSVADGLPDR